jgi:hypothetical protein
MFGMCNDVLLPLCTGKNTKKEYFKKIEGTDYSSIIRLVGASES